MRFDMRLSSVSASVQIYAPFSQKRRKFRPNFSFPIETFQYTPTLLKVSRKKYLSRPFEQNTVATRREHLQRIRVVFHRSFCGIIRSLTVKWTSSIRFHAGRTWIPIVCSLGLLALPACKSSPHPSSGAASRQAGSAPQIANSTVEPQAVNVVLITLDTVRPDHLHCYGDNKIKTPVIDSLAKNGVLFEDAVAQTPLTGPSHASIFTGENPNVHHVRNTGGFALQPSSVTSGDHTAKIGLGNRRILSVLLSWIGSSDSIRALRRMMIGSPKPSIRIQAN